MSKRNLQKLMLASAFTLTASAQAILEHAASAAGGSVAGVAGKKVSDGISAIMIKVASGAESEEGIPAPNPNRTPGGEHPPDWKPPVKTDSGKKTARPAQNTAADPSAAPPMRPPPMPVRAANVAPPIQAAYALSRWVPAGERVSPATPLSLAQVAAGTSIEELGLRLGIPAARVVIPGDDGHLLQLVRYRDHGGVVGVVHVMDGVVSQVEVR